MPTTRYRERLWVPVWWWPLGFGMAALIGYEVNLGARSLPHWISYTALGGVAIATLLWLSRVEVAVVDGAVGSPGVELWSGEAHLPVSVIAKTAVIPKSAKSAALGRQLDPAAYVMHRGWVGPMALVVLNDQDDPTPYWLVSSRHPDKVLDALGR